MKKIPAAQKFPTPPPHNFSNGWSLSYSRWVAITLQGPQNVANHSRYNQPIYLQKSDQTVYNYSMAYIDIITHSCQ